MSKKATTNATKAKGAAKATNEHGPELVQGQPGQGPETEGNPPETDPFLPQDIGPGDPDPRKAPALHFEPIGMDRDPYQQSFFRFDADGATIDCKYLRRYAKGEHERVEHACIEVETYPGKVPYLLPGNMQLWELFGADEAAGIDFERTVYRLTRIEAVPDPKNPDGKPKFVRFRTEAATL